MHMIRNAPDVIEHALLGPDDAAHVRIQSLRNLRHDPRITMLGAEDDVEQEL